MTTPTPRIAKDDLATLFDQSSRYVSFNRDERITSSGRPICDCCDLGCNDVIHFCSTPKGPWQGINSVNGMVCVECAREAGLQIHKSYGELERDLAAAREARQRAEALAERYETLLFKLRAMDEAPCFKCGYNGANYYHPHIHACAAKHHAAIDAASEP